jgi:lauroyl/myristoyl acyltransferase
MSLSSALLTPRNLELVRKDSWKFGRPKIIEAGLRYYEQHPEEVERIAANLAYVGLPNGPSQLERVVREILAHYYEKLFVLVKGYEAWWIASHRVETGESLAPFTHARETGRAVFVAQSHYGATYLLASVFMVHGIHLHMVGNFPEPVGTMLARNVDALREKFKTAKVSLLNLADPSVDVPMEMFRLLLSGEVVSNVFDENNAFSKPVTLLGRTVMGGSGMELFLRRFDDRKVMVVAPFLVRTSEDSFRLEADWHTLSGGEIVPRLFGSLEQRIRQDFAQWYFIHELHHSIPAEGGR